MYGLAPCSMGPTLASTLPCVSTMPFGSPVVPEVNRICSGVSAERPGHRPRFFLGQRAGPVFKGEAGKSNHDPRRELRQQHGIAYRQLRLHVGQLRAPQTPTVPMRIQRNSQHPAQHAAVKRGDPLRAVLRPQQHAIALAQSRVAPAARQNAPPSVPARRKSSPAAGCPGGAPPRCPGGTSEVVQQCGQMISHGRTRQDPW